MIVDPPRKGCGDAFLRQLLQYAPRRIVYVSCAAETQARDLAALLAAGYALRRVTPFDLFPQTRHIECVATLEWPDASHAPAPSQLPPSSRATSRKGKTKSKAKGGAKAASIRKPRGRRS